MFYNYIYSRKPWKTKELKRLAKALLALDSASDMQNFLRDIGTLEELREWSKRWQVVELLDKGTPYRKIAEQTGVSTATITRIAHWLNHGEGGYRAALRQKART